MCVVYTLTRDRNPLKSSVFPPKDRKMAQNPVDLSQDFIKSGMRLITHPSSDALLDKAKKKKYGVPEDRMSRPCGGAGGFDDFVERWHE